jgi:hypothetical protein
MTAGGVAAATATATAQPGAALQGCSSLRKTLRINKELEQRHLVIAAAAHGRGCWRCPRGSLRHFLQCMTVTSQQHAAALHNLQQMHNTNASFNMKSEQNTFLLDS